MARELSSTEREQIFPKVPSLLRNGTSQNQPGDPAVRAAPDLVAGNRPSPRVCQKLMFSRQLGVFTE